MKKSVEVKDSKKDNLKYFVIGLIVGVAVAYLIISVFGNGVLFSPCGDDAIANEGGDASMVSEDDDNCLVECSLFVEDYCLSLMPTEEECMEDTENICENDLISDECMGDVELICGDYCSNFFASGSSMVVECLDKENNNDGDELIDSYGKFYYEGGKYKKIERDPECRKKGFDDSESVL